MWFVAFTNKCRNTAVLVPSSATSRSLHKRATAPYFQSHSQLTSSQIPVIDDVSLENDDDDDEELAEEPVSASAPASETEPAARLELLVPHSHSPAHGTRHGYTNASYCAFDG